MGKVISVAPPFMREEYERVRVRHHPRAGDMVRCMCLEKWPCQTARLVATVEAAIDAAGRVSYDLGEAAAKENAALRGRIQELEILCDKLEAESLGYATEAAQLRDCRDDGPFSTGCMNCIKCLNFQVETRKENQNLLIARIAQQQDQIDRLAIQEASYVADLEGAIATTGAGLIATSTNAEPVHSWVCTQDVHDPDISWCQWCGRHQVEVVDWKENPACPALLALRSLTRLGAGVQRNE